MATKRKRLTFKQKNEVIKKFKAEIPKDDIIKEYGISEHTYYRLISSDPDSLKNENTYLYESRKSSRNCNNVLLDNAMIKWVTQERDRGNSITGQMLKDKALVFNKKLNGLYYFKASNGWVKRFKNRYGIKEARKINGKLTSDSSAAVEEFSQFLKEKIRAENLSLNNIYNADETGISWLNLVPPTVDSDKENEKEAEMEGKKEETEAEEKAEQEEAFDKLKENDEHLTALFCSNASGNHKIRLLIIDKSKSPRCLNNFTNDEEREQNLKTLKNLNVTYLNLLNGWMNKFIFMQWYKNEFVSQVLDRQKAAGKMEKVILILDNAPSHPNLEELNSVNKLFEVIFLPPNVTSFVQPMDQGIIKTTLQSYKQSLLQRLLLNETQTEAIDFLKQLNLRDILPLLQNSWANLRPSTLQNAWKPILGDSFVTSFISEAENSPRNLPENFGPVKIEDDVDDRKLNEKSSLPYFEELFTQCATLLSGFAYFHRKTKLVNWYYSNDCECGWETLSDEDIVNSVINDTFQETNEIVGNANEIVPENNSMVTVISGENSESNSTTAKTHSMTLTTNSVTTSTTLPSDTVEREIPENTFFPITTKQALESAINLKKWINSCEASQPIYKFYIQELEEFVRSQELDAFAKSNLIDIVEEKPDVSLVKVEVP